MEPCVRGIQEQARKRRRLQEGYWGYVLQAVGRYRRACQKENTLIEDSTFEVGTFTVYIIMVSISNMENIANWFYLHTNQIA